MKVSKIMTPDVEFISPGLSTKEAARIMHDLHIGSLPVMEDDQLLGIITDRDICCKVTATGRDAGWTKVEEIMTTGVTTCFEDEDITDAASLMVNNHIRRLAVLNRDNGIAGLLSVDDLAHTSYDLASSVLEATTPQQ